jgi:hypothetical protein
MSEDQRQDLECGFAYFAAGPVFRNEAQRRACWLRHRRQIMAAWDRPGERPRAMWAFDLPELLAEHDGNEAAAVHARLADAPERRQIELRWLDELRIAVATAAAPEHVADVAQGRGVPPWFAEQHAPDLLASVDADRRGMRRGEVVVLPAGRRRSPG